VKGAFTGADRDEKRLFEEANGGTRFLDVPPLRERRGDIPLLVRLFFDETTRESGRAPPTVSEYSEPQRRTTRRCVGCGFPGFSFSRPAREESHEVTRTVLSDRSRLVAAMADRLERSVRAGSARRMDRPDRLEGGTGLLRAQCLGAR
jgi:transcriptional regulator with GAF, ATPase, and Fis domain